MKTVHDQPTRPPQERLIQATGGVGPAEATTIVPTPAILRRNDAHQTASLDTRPNHRA